MSQCQLYYIRLAIVTAALAAVISSEQNQPPHIVFILVDDLGLNDVGYNAKLHGSAIRTPNIDRLASEGVILDNYYVEPLCTPTRAALLTGRYPIRYGLQHHVITPSQPSCLPPDEVTLMEKLQDIGYSTHAVGKWHLGFYKEECLPTNRGFQTFFGMYSSTMDHFTYVKNVTFPDNTTASGIDLHDDNRVHMKPAWDDVGHYSTELLTREAQKVIRRHDHKKPLFLYLSYISVHDPLQVPEHYKEPYRDLIADEQRLTLAGMVSCVDESVANLTDTLKKFGLYKNTVIIFSTDNGGSVLYTGNNWPLRGSKDTLYEGAIRGVGFIHSPLLPNKIKGTISHAWIHVTDWFPTILSSLAGGDINIKKPIDGIDVWESIVSNGQSPRKELLHSIDPIPYPLPGYTGRAALRMGDWKLMLGKNCPDHSGTAYFSLCGWYPPLESDLSPLKPEESLDKKIWLFNIARDPLEKQDLAIRRPGIVKRMMKRILEYNEMAVPPSYPPPDPNSNPENNGGVWGPWE